MKGFHYANFELPRPFRSRVRSRHASDRRTPQRVLLCPSPTGGDGVITQNITRAWSIKCDNLHSMMLLILDLDGILVAPLGCWERLLLLFPGESYLLQVLLDCTFSVYVVGQPDSPRLCTLEPPSLLTWYLLVIHPKYMSSPKSSFSEYVLHALMISSFVTMSFQETQRHRRKMVTKLNLNRY